MDFSGTGGLIKMQPPTVTPRWGTWIIDWECAKDPWDAFDIWRHEMYTDYEWFEDYCESKDFDSCVIIDWYWHWGKSKVSLFYRIGLILTVSVPSAIFYHFKRLKKYLSK
jgi:hypothetical protein